MISLALAHLLGTLVGLMLFGVSATIFMTTVCVINKSTSRGRIVHTALALLFVLGLTYYSLAVYNLCIAFSILESNSGTDDFLTNGWRSTSPVAAAKDIVYMFSLLIADSLLIWRLYVIWPGKPPTRDLSWLPPGERSVPAENRVALVLAGVLLSSSVVAGIGVSVYEIKQAIVGDQRYLSRIYHWTTAGSVAILCTNLLVTTCIAGRLWWIRKEVAILGVKAQTTYERITYIVIQSGDVYCSCVITQLVLYGSGAVDAAFLFLQMSPAIVTMAPTAIILQLRLRSLRKLEAETPKSRFDCVSTGWAFARPPSGNSIVSENYTTREPDHLHDLEAIPDFEPTPSLTAVPSFIICGPADSAETGLEKTEALGDDARSTSALS